MKERKFSDETKKQSKLKAMIMFSKNINCNVLVNVKE